MLQVNTFAYQVAQYPQANIQSAHELRSDQDVLREHLQRTRVVSVPLARPPNGVAVNGMGVTLPRTPSASTPRAVTPRPLRANAAQTIERVASQAAVASTMPESPKQQPTEQRQADAELRRATVQEKEDFYGWFVKASESVLQSADALGQDVARLAHLVDNCEGQIAKLRDDFGGQQKQVDELCQNRRAVEEARGQELAEREAILAKLGSVGREAEVMRLEHKKILDEAVLSIRAQREDQRGEHRSAFEALLAGQQEEQRKALQAALADIAAQREEWRASHTHELGLLEGLTLRLSEDQERLQGMSQSVVESLGGMRDELLAIRSEQEDAIKREACAMAEALRKEQTEAMKAQAEAVQAAVCKEIRTEREDAIKSQAGTIAEALRRELEEVIHSQADAMRAAVCKDVEALQTQFSASQLNERRGKAAASPEQLEALEQAVCEELQLIKKESSVLASQLRELTEDRVRQAQVEAAENGPRAEEKLEGQQHRDLATSRKFEEFALQLTQLTQGVDEIRMLFAANNLEEHAALLNAESEARLALKESLDAQCNAHAQICAELRSDFRAALERVCLLETGLHRHQDVSLDKAMLEGLVDQLTGSHSAPARGCISNDDSALQADALATLRDALQKMVGQHAACTKQEISAQMAKLCRDVDELRDHVSKVGASCRERKEAGNPCDCSLPAVGQGAERKDLEAGSARAEAGSELQSMVHFQDKFNEFSTVVWERLLDLGSTQDALIRQTSEIARLDKDVEAALGKLKQLDGGCGDSHLQSELAELRADLKSLRASAGGPLQAQRATGEGQEIADEVNGLRANLSKLSVDSIRDKLPGFEEAATPQCRRSLALEISQAEGTPEPMSSKGEACEEHPELQKAIVILHNTFDPLAQELSEFRTDVLDRLNRLETTQDAHAIILQTREVSQLDTQLQALHGRLGYLESVHKEHLEQSATAQLCESANPELADMQGRLTSAESMLREVAQLSQDVDAAREDGNAVSKQATSLRKELSSLVERLTRLEFTVAEGAASALGDQQEQHLQIVRALHVDVQTILKRLARLEQLSSELGADHFQNVQATTDLRMQVDRAMDRIARVESGAGEQITALSQSLVSFGSAPTSPAQASRSPERGEVKFSFSQLRSELDAVLGRLAYSEATAEEDRCWRERTTKGIQRMEQSLGEHGDAIRAVSEAFEALCSTKAMDPKPETLLMQDPPDAVT